MKTPRGSSCYTLDTVSPLVERLGVTTGSTTTWYARGWGQELSRESSGTVTWLLADRLGSVRAEYTSSGTLSTSYDYDPYGVPEGRTTPSDYGFTGEPYDGERGLVHLRARWYAPEQGRFLSRDPFPGVPTRPQSLLPYSYAENSPATLTDPTGLVASGLCIADMWDRGRITQQRFTGFWYGDDPDPCPRKVVTPDGRIICLPEGPPAPEPEPSPEPEPEKSLLEKILEACEKHPAACIVPPTGTADNDYRLASFYHGTDNDSAKDIVANEIRDVSVNRARGPGFYTFTNEEFAEDWGLHAAIAENKIPAVVRITMRRIVFEELKKLKMISEDLWQATADSPPDPSIWEVVFRPPSFPVLNDRLFVRREWKTRDYSLGYGTWTQYGP